MKRKLVFLILIYCLIVCGVDNAFAGYYEQGEYSDSKKSEIFNPSAIEIENRGGARAGLKVDCNQVTVDFNMNIYLEKAEKVLTMLLQNLKLLALNKTISAGINMYAYGECSKRMGGYLAEHPEQAQKLVACVAEGAGNSTAVSAGFQGGSWLPVWSLVPLPWINGTIDTDNAPGTPAKVMSCVMNVMGDAMGESFRSCIHQTYRDTLRYIRELMEFEQKEDIQLNWVSKQECLLDQQRAENDISVNLSSRIMPDGSKIEGDVEGGALVTKLAFSHYSPSKKELVKIFTATDNYFENLVVKNTRFTEKKSVRILKWYEKFRTGTWKRAEYVCLDTFPKPGNDNDIYMVQVDTCGFYIKSIYDLMVKKSLSSPLAAIGTRAERKFSENAYKKMAVSIEQERDKYKQVTQQINTNESAQDVKRKKEFQILKDNLKRLKSVESGY